MARRPEVPGGGGGAHQSPKGSPCPPPDIKTTRNGSISVRKSHKTGFSRNGDFDARLEISNPFQAFFFFLFWCLKHVLGEVMGSFLFPTQPARRGLHRPAPGNLSPASRSHPLLGSAGARWVVGRAAGSGGTPPWGCGARQRGGVVGPSARSPPPGLAEPLSRAGEGGRAGVSESAFHARPDLSQKWGACSNRKNNSVSQGRQYFSAPKLLLGRESLSRSIAGPSGLAESPGLHPPPPP